MKRTLETLACLALSLALVGLFSAIALGVCGFFD